MNTHEINQPSPVSIGMACFDIIEAGYQTLLRKYHPDRFDKKDRVIQDEVCKQLAVARDRLLGLLSAGKTFRIPPIPQPAHAKAEPIITVETAQLFIDFLGGALGIKPRYRKVGTRKGNRA